MGADFCYHVSLAGCYPSLYLSQNVTFSHLLFGRVLKREGVIFPPCEGGLKVGANFNFQVFLRDITHPNLPSFREGAIYPPYEGGLKEGADFNSHVSLSG